MKKFVFSLVLCSVLATLSSCGGGDLALINQVKRFEPEWTFLSEKVSFVDRNLRATHRRYEPNFEAVDPYLTNTRLMSRYRMPSMRSQMLNVISQRDSIQTHFDEQKERFLTELYGFNEWENELMDGDLGKNEAYASFGTYKQTVKEMRTEMDQLQDLLISNIEEHNSIFRQLSNALGLYQNYDLNPR